MLEDDERDGKLEIIVFSELYFVNIYDYEAMTSHYLTWLPRILMILILEIVIDK